MIIRLVGWAGLALGLAAAMAAEFRPASQRFEQEVAARYTVGIPEGKAQLLELTRDDQPQVFANGQWFRLRESRWEPVPELTCAAAGEFVLPDAEGTPLRIQLPWTDVRQIVRQKRQIWLATVERQLKIPSDDN